MLSICNRFHKHVTKRCRAITVDCIFNISQSLSIRDCVIMIFTNRHVTLSSVTPSFRLQMLVKKKESLLHSPRLYHTSISPLSVRTSMIVCPRKSSDSRLNFCLTRDFMSSSSSHTRTFIRSEELWHSLKTHISLGLIFSYTTMDIMDLKLAY